MNKKIIIIVSIISVVMLFSGCFGGGGNQQSQVKEPTGEWKDTTDYVWTTNGTCCGEKETMKQEYIVDGDVEKTRWVDTGMTKNNNSMLPPDTWYPTGNGNIYVREEEFRKYICMAGECIPSINETRWLSTGAIVMENISGSKDITINRGPSQTWYFVVDPMSKPVNISFRVLADGYANLPIFVSNGMVTVYHSGAVVLPEEYMISIRISSGSVTVHILDETGYKQMYPQ